MKKQNKPKPKFIQELAGQFEEELNRALPLSIQPDGSVIYKNFIVKKTKLGNWGLYNLKSKYLIDEYHLKTCALMGAKQYTINLNKFFEIKRVDTQYWANYSDNQVYRINIKKVKDFSRYLILLNKLEYSQERTDHFKEQISRMFKWTFV